MFKRMTGILCAVLLVLSFILHPVSALGQEDFRYSRELFEEIRERVEEGHVDIESESELYKDAIEGYLKGLKDPHTTYFTPDEYEKFTENLDKRFHGIGIVISEVEDYIVVVSPIAGSPGEMAGLKSGDKIIGVDGEDIVGTSAEYASSLIRGEIGTVVNLTVIRGSDSIEFSIERDLIEIPSIEYSMTGPVGYIRIYDFSDHAAVEVYRAVHEMKAKGLEGLVIDVRGNPGGYLNSALYMAGSFLKGQIMTVVNRDGSEVKVSAPAGLQYIFVPAVVLVNEGSASASEIFAGALKHHDRAELVGRQTFGKGSVQSVFRLQNGGYLKMTTAYYCLPDGFAINGVGITPDYIVEDEEAQLEKAYDVLRKKIGREMIISLAEPEAKWVDLEIKLPCKPALRQDTWLIPFDTVLDSFGDGFEWINRRQEVSFTWDGREYVLPAGENTVIIDGEEFAVDQGLRMISGVRMIPVNVLQSFIGIGAVVEEDNDRIILRH